MAMDASPNSCRGRPELIKHSGMNGGNVMPTGKTTDRDSHPASPPRQPCERRSSHFFPLTSHGLEENRGFRPRPCCLLLDDILTWVYLIAEADRNPASADGLPGRPGRQLGWPVDLNTKDKDIRLTRHSKNPVETLWDGPRRFKIRTGYQSFSMIPDMIRY